MNIKVFKAIIALLTVVILILGGLLMAQKTEMTKKWNPCPTLTLLSRHRSARPLPKLSAPSDNRTERNIR